MIGVIPTKTRIFFRCKGEQKQRQKTFNGQVGLKEIDEFLGKDRFLLEIVKIY